MMRQQVCLHGHNTRKTAHFHDHKACVTQAIMCAMLTVPRQEAGSKLLALHLELFPKSREHYHQAHLQFELQLHEKSHVRKMPKQNDDASINTQILTK